MTEVAEVTRKTFVDFVLPPSVVTKIDISHLILEMEQLDSMATAAGVRAKSGVGSPAIPPLSEPLKDFLVQNQLKIDDSMMRTDIIKQMRLLKEKVPVLSMTFAVSVDQESLLQLSQWIRTNIHPQAVLAVGKQPALVAGVYLRTPNRAKDLSMRAKLAENRDLLFKELEALHG